MGVAGFGGESPQFGLGVRVAVETPLELMSNVIAPELRCEDLLRPVVSVDGLRAVEVRGKDGNLAQGLGLEARGDEWCDEQPRTGLGPVLDRRVDDDFRDRGEPDRALICALSNSLDRPRDPRASESLRFGGRLGPAGQGGHAAVRVEKGIDLGRVPWLVGCVDKRRDVIGEPVSAVSSRGRHSSCSISRGRKQPSTISRWQMPVARIEGVVMHQKTLLSRRETAEILGLSTDSIDRLVAAGKLRSIRFGRAVRIKAESVERLAQEGAATPSRGRT